jgi:hypothetical protein
MVNQSVLKEKNRERRDRHQRRWLTVPKGIRDWRRPTRSHCARAQKLFLAVE